MSGTVPGQPPYDPAVGPDDGMVADANRARDLEELLRQASARIAEQHDIETNYARRVPGCTVCDLLARIDAALPPEES